VGVGESVFVGAAREADRVPRERLAGGGPRLLALSAYRLPHSLSLTQPATR
jgi:hypothetical protein